MPPTLPFSEFIDALRDKDFGVGLHEYLAVGKLLGHWNGTNRDELRNSLAALIARHDEEVAAIRKLFDEFYPAPIDREDRGPDRGGKPDRDKRDTFTFVRLVRSPWVWAALIVVAALVAAAALTVRTLVNQPQPLVASPLRPPPAAGPLPVPTETPTASPYAQVLVQPPPVGLPPPPAHVDWRAVGGLAGSAVLLTLLPIWGTRMRGAARRWTAAAWQSALTALPGPFHGTLVLKDLITRLPKADVEEAATIMGRAFSHGQRGGKLDVVRSLNATLRAGMQPHLVFRPRRSLQAILVLRDISQPMAIHTRRVTRFVADLRAQGIAVDEWLFDGHIGQPMPRLHSVSVSLDALLRRRQDGPLMILSTGHGVAASLAGADHSWVSALRQQTRRVWINPIADAKLWTGALQRLPIAVVPMTRGGLLQAARLLTQDDRTVSMSLGRLASRTPLVTKTHVGRLKQMASLVPYPTVELLELLRQRFAPDIPESAVLYTVNREATLGNLPFRMADAEIQSQLHDLRTESPALEAPVRRYLINVLADSRPPAGSAAELRWQASVAIHEAHLADLQHASGDAAVAKLRALYEGPLWEEVRDMVNRQSTSGPATSALRTTVGLQRRDADPPRFSRDASGPRIERFRWIGPGWRAVTAAAIAGVIVVPLGAFTRPFRVQANHRTDAYVLDYVPATGGAPDQLIVRPAPLPQGASALPPTVQLYLDGNPIGAPIATDSSQPFSLAAPTGTSHIYQARAPLPDGGLALSNTVWAPSVFVVIDVLPWANVTVSSSTLPGFTPITQTTPISIRLPEGAYTLRLENGGLQPESTETITVTAAGTRTFQFSMPGYTPAGALQQLGIRRPAQSAK